ncbi:MAG TPA: gamma-glutamyltransferase [Methylococcaceae bacterium]|jgi:gamma-glutamyltranspeptidase/glutathione hydrolase|nr:gamma-glutamyltransferase [Methylococcaceae bacterium]HIN69180.1 gamma-glutamyltransferase [Methylococcales bacterium]HIA46283.1 gamma-glutamyltransferase [Methylococcaceae bacterium]HIB61886.1 gamma-glutamyltransferase [Methylococcaceae bacterium]HIO13416.1 gamma-glutamyltransferase [Methylococcales bacterium]
MGTSTFKQLISSGLLTLKAVLVVYGLINSVCFAQTKQVAIASAQPLATHAGLAILASGGNAFDAAVAVAAVLSVVEPQGSGLGGGGFFLLHRARDKFDVMIDAREKAPLAAHQGLFQNEQGQVIKNASTQGPLAAGVPGLPAGLVHLSENYGRLPLAVVLKPAINLAEKGFHVGKRFRRLLQYRTHQMTVNSQLQAIFYDQGQLPATGFLLQQKDLARTLRLLSALGWAGFYQGEIATLLVDSVQKGGGIWTLADLAAYQVVERKPVFGQYRGIKITSAAPPSSGGIVLVEILNILAGYPLDTMTPVMRKHLIIEAMRRAYRDRAVYLGDPDFVQIPVKQLLSADYAAGLRVSIQSEKALPSILLNGPLADQAGGEDTTHFSIMDHEGNRVAATLSINFPFGSGFVASGTGVVLNNEMDDFVSRIGTVNGYGLMGGTANLIVGGKRMLSSMTPTFLEDEHRIVVLGTPGGSRIISMVLLAILEFAKGTEIQAIVDAPRFHHQFIPDKVQYESDALTGDEIKALKQRGHRLEEKNNRYGDMQAVLWQKENNQVMKAASDFRGEGLALVR